MIFIVPTATRCSADRLRIGIYLDSIYVKLEKILQRLSSLKLTDIDVPFVLELAKLFIAELTVLLVLKFYFSMFSFINDISKI